MVAVGPEAKRVKVGDRVRFWVVSAGPTHPSHFHVVGEQFDTVYLGAPPGTPIRGVQTFTVPAGGGMVFELVCDVAGEERHADRRQGFRQSHDAEGERIMGEIIDLPADDRALDLDAQREREQADDVALELGVPKRIGLGGRTERGHERV